MFRLIACSMFQRFTCLMYVYTNTRTQIPLDTYKQVYHQTTKIRFNYAKCYNLREILLICVRCCSNMSNILFNQATFHAIGQSPFLAWPMSIKPSFLRYWNPKNVSKLVFLLRHTKIAISKKTQSNRWFMAQENQSMKYCRMQSLTNLCYSNNSYFKEI